MLQKNEIFHGTMIPLNSLWLDYNTVKLMLDSPSWVGKALLREAPLRKVQEVEDAREIPE
jgi:hypothetical protein